MFFSPFGKQARKIAQSRKKDAASRHKLARASGITLEGLEERRLMSFTSPALYPTGATPTSMAIADFNHDGKSDIVTSGSASGIGQVFVNLNNGDGTFGASQSSKTGNTPISVKACDFDGDGNQDVVTLASYYTGALTVLKGNGDGTFQPPTSYTVSLPPTSIEVGDVNNDGHPDLIAGNRYFSAVSVYLNDGTGVLKTPVNLPGTSVPGSVEVADFNHDLINDISATNSTGAGTVNVMLSNGNGTFQPVRTNAAGSTPVAQAIGDFNGDGNLDIAVANSAGAAYITVLDGNGDGTFKVARTIPLGAQPLDIQQGDFDHDGKLDLIERNATGFSIETGNGDGTFNSPVLDSVSTGNNIGVADFNGDGGADIALSSTSGQVGVYINDNSGLVGIATTTNFVLSAPASTVAGAPIAVTVSVVDVDGNLVKDFAGPVQILSTDGRSPGAIWNFTAADQGKHTFATGVTLFTAGTQTLMATGAFIGTGAQAITVTPGTASFLSLSAPATAAAGTPVNVNIMAVDPYGNMGAAYTGTVHFTSTDGQAVLPADYTFTPADNGVHSVSVTYKSATYDSITATDIANPLFKGTSNYTVVQAGAVSQLLVIGGSGSIGKARTVWIYSADTYGNIVRTDSRTVHLTSSDPATVLSGDVSIVAGQGIASATLFTLGNQTFTATDATDGTIAGSETVIGSAADVGSFKISGFTPSSVAGSTGTFTVTAFDVLGNPMPGYIGTVYFSSTDYQAGLPAACTFTAADAGTRTFSASLKTAGVQSITAYDPTFAAGGTMGGLTVVAASASSLTSSGPHNVVAGSPFNMVITARDVYGNIATTYQGKLKFTSTDVLAGLPTDYKFTATDAGIHSFPITLKTATSQTNLWGVSATDASSPLLNTTLSAIDVTNGPAAKVVLAWPSSVTAGTPFDLKVSLLDAFGNKVKNYSGTVHFGGVLGLPADYTFTGADAGVHTFSLTLTGTTAQTISVTDTGTSSLLASFTVTPKAAASTGGGGSGGGSGGGGGGGKKVV